MTADPRPNILIFLVDQMPADVLRDDHQAQMPALRAFARQGLTMLGVEGHRLAPSEPESALVHPSGISLAWVG